MPTSEKISRLMEFIRLLNEATDRNGIRWEPTLDEEEFRAILHAGMVKILKKGENIPGIIGNPLFGEEKFILQILDASNRVIDFLIPGSPEEAEQLKELFWKARRSALGVDQLYGDLLKELQSRAGK